MCRCLLLEAKLPKYLWAYAVLAASCIRNRCYNVKLNNTPYEALTGVKPSVQNMNIFGTVCYAYVQEKKKLDPRSDKGLLLGYDKYSPAYFVYFPETQKIKKVRRVVFTNEFLKVSEDVNQADYCDDDNYQTAIPREERAELPQSENIPESTRRYPVRERRPPEYFYSVDGDNLMITMQLMLMLTFDIVSEISPSHLLQLFIHLTLKTGEMLWMRKCIH